MAQKRKSDNEREGEEENGRESEGIVGRKEGRTVCRKIKKMGHGIEQREKDEIRSRFSRREKG